MEQSFDNQDQVYEAPQALRLDGRDAGAGDVTCGAPGSGDISSCSGDGNGALANCQQAGNDAVGDCQMSGVGAVNYCSLAGEGYV